MIMIHNNKQITKVLISLHKCAGWSAPLLFAHPEDRCSHVKAHIVSYVHFVSVFVLSCMFVLFMYFTIICTIFILIIAWAFIKIIPIYKEGGRPY